MTWAGLIQPRSVRQRVVLVLAIFVCTAIFGVYHASSDRLNFFSATDDRTIHQPSSHVANFLGSTDHLTDAACEAFDPDGSASDDPEGCLRARQYRQVQRVLARERLHEHEHWYFTRPHNIATLERLLVCFATFPSPCPPRPLIISSWWYTAGVLTKSVSGEAIWQKGIMKFVDELGLYFIAVGPYNNWLEVIEMMPDVYRVLWGADLDIVSCATDPRCVAEYVPPEGAEDMSIGVPPEERGVIPLWALNVVDYTVRHIKQRLLVGLTSHGDWSYHPLGQQWIATPWPLPGHFHLPYSIEEFCPPEGIKSHSERNDSVLILAKRTAYFDYRHLAPRHYWTNLSQEGPFELWTTAKLDDGHPMPDGLVSLGAQSRNAYVDLVGSVRVLLGIGAPTVSPSVYDALCHATPVVVAYMEEEPRLDGWHMYSTHLQHGPAQSIGEPYVYGYHIKNYTQMSEVVHRAYNTPIDRYIPPDMRYEYGLEQMRNYLHRDLYGMFQRIVREHGGIPRLQQGVRERCFELKRCLPLLPEGRTPLAPP